LPTFARGIAFLSAPGLDKLCRIERILSGAGVEPLGIILFQAELVAAFTVASDDEENTDPPTPEPEDPVISDPVSM
jgi:hypothetical protein